MLIVTCSCKSRVCFVINGYRWWKYCCPFVMLCIWVKVLFTMLAHVILFISKCLTSKFCAVNSVASSKVLHFLNCNSLKFFLFCKANVSLPVNIFLYVENLHIGDFIADIFRYNNGIIFILSYKTRK